MPVFQGANEIARAMEHPSYDLVSGLPEIDAYMERIQGLFLKLSQFLKEIRVKKIVVLTKKKTTKKKPPSPVTIY